MNFPSVAHGWLQFSIHHLEPHGLRISALEFVSSNQVFQLNTARASETLMMLHPAIVKLVGIIATDFGKGIKTQLNVSRFYKKLGDLVLEDLQIIPLDGTEMSIRFRVTDGEFQDILVEKTAQRKWKRSGRYPAAAYQFSVLFEINERG